MPDRPSADTAVLADDTEFTGLDLSDLVLDGRAAGGRVWRERRFVDCTVYDADLHGLVTERCVFDDEAMAHYGYMHAVASRLVIDEAHVIEALA